MSKTAIVVFSDPKTGSEEALGRLFNALCVALALKQQREHVELIFQGTGVRWVVARTGHQLVRELNIPGTNGIVDLSKYLDDGYRLLSF